MRLFNTVGSGNGYLREHGQSRRDLGCHDRPVGFGTGPPSDPFHEGHEGQEAQGRSKVKISSGSFVVSFVIYFDHTGCVCAPSRPPIAALWCCGVMVLWCRWLLRVGFRRIESVTVKKAIFAFTGAINRLVCHCFPLNDVIRSCLVVLRITVSGYHKLPSIDVNTAGSIFT